MTESIKVWLCKTSSGRRALFITPSEAKDWCLKNTPSASFEGIFLPNKEALGRGLLCERCKNLKDKCSKLVYCEKCVDELASEMEASK